jgi:hypothetical protein
MIKSSKWNEANGKKKNKKEKEKQIEIIKSITQDLCILY